MPPTKSRSRSQKAAAGGMIKSSSVHKTHNSTSASTSKSTPARSAMTSPCRSPSPVVFSRVEEKNELASLNDRLADYINRVRHLETDNERLKKVTTELEETVRREVNGVKGIYDAELAEARRLLDETAIERTKFLVEVGVLRADNETLTARLETAGEERSQLTERLQNAESQLIELKSLLADSNNNKHRLLGDENMRQCVDSESVLSAMSENVERLETQIVQLQYTNTSLSNQLSLQTEARQQFQHFRQSQTAEAKESFRRKCNSINSNILVAVQEMRQENERRIIKFKTQQQRLMLETLKDTEVWKDLASAVQEENLIVVDAVTSAADGNQRQHQQQQQRSVATDATQSDTDVQQTRKLIVDQLTKFNSQVADQFLLDTELSVYRKLLETVERPQASPSS